MLYSISIPVSLKNRARQTALNQQSTTAGVMNYLTSDKAVSIFPISTFTLRKSYVAKTKRYSVGRTPVWEKKYRDRGFRVVHKRSRGTHDDLTLGKRTSSDRHCWIIKLKSKLLTRTFVRFTRLTIPIPTRSQHPCREGALYTAPRKPLLSMS